MICPICDKPVNVESKPNKVCCCIQHKKLLDSLKDRKELFKLSIEEKNIYNKLKLNGFI